MTRGGFVKWSVLCAVMTVAALLFASIGCASGAGPHPCPAGKHPVALWVLR